MIIISTFRKSTFEIGDAVLVTWGTDKWPAKIVENPKLKGLKPPKPGIKSHVVYFFGDHLYQRVNETKLSPYKKPAQTDQFGNKMNMAHDEALEFINSSEN